VPENGREDGGGNQRDAQRVLPGEPYGLTKDESARFGLRIALHDFVFSSDDRVGMAVLRQEGRLSGCESVRGIEANISRDVLAAAVHHGESPRCAGRIASRGAFAYSGNIAEPRQVVI
jgi:hypothetical protein